ncbi:hypothetical protein BV898_11088 [Hypsibius exemplaris]|uniref:Protein quiver n=1 Tax=Hypsibius exemplaris TaxID=2072580 RepID=A0A1W0WHN1_HYPEX|nr:hypothetical protein BV898_11088 [Hypsibius exemplaris]
MHLRRLLPTYLLAPTLYLLSSSLQGLNALSCVICDSMTDENCATISVTNPIKAQDCWQWCSARGGWVPKTERSQADAAARKASYPEVSCPLSGMYTTCRKITQTVLANSQRKWANAQRVIRSCGFIGNETTQSASTYKKSESSKTEVFNCFQDGCNGSSRTSSISVAVCLASALIIWYFADTTEHVVAGLHTSALAASVCLVSGLIFLGPPVLFAVPN